MPVWHSLLFNDKKNVCSWPSIYICTWVNIFVPLTVPTRGTAGTTRLQEMLFFLIINLEIHPQQRLLNYILNIIVYSSNKQNILCRLSSVKTNFATLGRQYSYIGG